MEAINLRGLLLTLLRYWWLILAVVALAGALAWLRTRGEVAIYRSAAVIEIEDQRKTQLLATAGSETEDVRSPEVIETIIRSFKHRSLMESLSRRLGLATDARFLGFEPGLPVEQAAITEILLASSEASLVRGTRLIEVSFSHRDPAVAREMAGALIDQFRENKLQQQLQSVERQSATWSEKKRALEEKLNASERERQRYNDQAGGMSLEERRNAVSLKQQLLGGELNAAQSELMKLQVNASLMKKAAPDATALLALPLVAQDPEVSRLREAALKAEGEVASLSKRYRDKYPALMHARAEWTSFRDEMNRAVLTAPARLEARLKAAEGQVKVLAEALAAQGQLFADLDKRAIEFHKLQREYELDRTLFESVLQREKESLAVLNTSPTRFNVVEPPLPSTPLGNGRWIVIAGCAFGGGTLAIMAIAGCFLMATTIRTVDESERVLGTPVLSAVPTLNRKERSGLREGQLSPEAAESFRTLRTALTLRGEGQEQPRVILVTSAAAGEGKSFCASQMAVAFARQGLRTLIIDCDLRSPALHPTFLQPGMSPPGVSDYLSRRPSKVYETAVENLWILPAGTPTDQPAELLASARCQKMVLAMREEFDRVIVDTAPVALVSDTLSMVSFVDALCLVVRCGSTRRELVFRALELLRRTGTKPSGVLLNRVPRSRLVSHYYDYATGYRSTNHAFALN